MKPKLFDAVQLREALLGEGLAKGAIGAIVMEFDKPHEAYEVEFVDDSGATLAQVTFRPSQFAVVWTAPQKSADAA